MSPTLHEFWNQCAHHISGGSRPTYLSGWVMAFCFWDEEGKCLDNPECDGNAILDGVEFHIIDTDKIPVGYSSVPVNYPIHFINFYLPASCSRTIYSVYFTRERPPIPLHTSPHAGWYLPLTIFRTFVTRGQRIEEIFISWVTCSLKIQTKESCKAAKRSMMSGQRRIAPWHTQK